MKSIILLALVVISMAAHADDIQDAALACMAYSISSDGTSAADYAPGFERCAPLVEQWRDKWKAQQAASERERKARDIAKINKGLQAAGLPLLSE